MAGKTQGMVDKAKGKAKEVIGSVRGNKTQQGKGKTQKNVGKAEQKIGQAQQPRRAKR